MPVSYTHLDVYKRQVVAVTVLSAFQTIVAGKVIELVMPLIVKSPVIFALLPFDAIFLITKFAAGNLSTPKKSSAFKCLSKLAFGLSPSICLLYTSRCV